MSPVISYSLYFNFDRCREHLYRNHKAAPYCKRCWKIFDTNELKDQHTTVPANQICEAVPGEPPEGVTPNQVSELRSRGKPYSKLSESERWNEIFRLLFPGANIPSPCKCCWAFPARIRS